MKRRAGVKTMNYDQVVAYLESLSDIERSPTLAGNPPRFNLARVERLLAEAGRPQERFDCVHIAGTKGKGSTAALIDAVLRVAGYRVGLFTSPHLHSFRERVSVDGECISEPELAALTTKVVPLVRTVQSRFPELGDLTTFEVTTAIALRHFANQCVDYAVIEAGLGGRLDATNVVRPKVAVITSLSLDHTRFLGDTLLQIAAEKAGIVKPGVPVVVAPQEPVVMALLHRTCAAKGSRLVEVGRDVRWTARHLAGGECVSVQGRLGRYADLTLPLMGAHQAINAAVAVAALEVLIEQGVHLNEDDLHRGFGGVWWPGRLETVALAPRVVVDGAHNVDSMRRLSETLAAVFPQRRLIVLLGASLDKDIPGMVREIAPRADVFIATRSAHPRSLETAVLAREARQYGGEVHQAADIATALRLAITLAGKEDLICATGSLFVVAEAREAVGLKSFGDRFFG